MDVKLFLDEETANELQGLIYDIGEHFAAGAPIRRQSPESDTRIGRVYREILRQLGKQTTAEAVEEWLDKVQSGLRDRNEHDLVEEALQNFLMAMSQKDIESAFHLLSPRGQQMSDIARLHRQVAGAEFASYQGFSRVWIGRYGFSETDTTVQMHGEAVISYTNDQSGRLEVQMEKIGRRWLVESWIIFVLPSKVAETLQGNEAST